MIIEKIVSQDTLNKVYKDKTCDLDLEQYSPNDYFILKSETGSSSALLRFQKQDFNIALKLLSDSDGSVDKVRGKDVKQRCLIDSLMDPSIRIVSVQGPAGCGKTFLSCHCAYWQMKNKRYEQIILTKPTVAVGGDRYFGAAPGTVEEKFNIFLDSFRIAFEDVLGSTVQFEMEVDKGRIQFKPIQFVRGNSWKKTLLIIDEAQNLNWHELKTILSRLGEGSKAILLGDRSQKDKKEFGYENLYKNHLYTQSELTSHVELTEDYRGPISKLISQIDEDMNK